MIRKFFYSEKSTGIHFEKLPSNIASDTAIVFLHGIIGSGRCWGNAFTKLQNTASLYYLDLLGFGFSKKPDAEYSLVEHVEVVHTFIEQHVSERKIIIVGHSAGSIIAAKYAATYTNDVQKVILISLPYYHSEDEAKKYISMSQIFTFFAMDTVATRITCFFVCTVFGSLSRFITPLFNKQYPRAVVEDYFRHSYASYMRTLIRVVYRQNLLPDLDRIKNKIVMIHGGIDTTVPKSHIQELARKYSIPFYELKNGDHFLPTLDDDAVVQIIRKEIQ